MIPGSLVGANASEQMAKQAAAQYANRVEPRQETLTDSLLAALQMNNERLERIAFGFSSLGDRIFGPTPSDGGQQPKEPAPMTAADRIREMLAWQQRLVDGLDSQHQRLQRIG